MLVRVNIIGDVANEPIYFPVNSNAEAVEKKLLGGFGKGILKQNGVVILSDTLATGEYEYQLTTQQGQLFQLHAVVEPFS